MKAQDFDTLQQALTEMGMINVCIICREEMFIDRDDSQRWRVCSQDRHFVTDLCPADDVDLESQYDYISGKNRWYANCSACGHEFEVEDEKEFNHIRDNKRSGWKKLKWIVSNLLAVRIRNVIIGFERVTIPDIVSMKQGEVRRQRDHEVYHLGKLIEAHLELEKLKNDPKNDFNKMWDMAQEIKLLIESLETKVEPKYKLWDIEFHMLSCNLGHVDPRIKKTTGHFQDLHWSIDLFCLNFSVSRIRYRECEEKPCRDCREENRSIVYFSMELSN